MKKRIQAVLGVFKNKIENHPENKNKVHPEVSLLRISRLLGCCCLITTNNKKKGGPELQLFRTTSLFNNDEPPDTYTRGWKTAFTLIELLVVVLIIGILAAIALPQYEKAVEKARFTQYQTLAANIAQAVQVSYLANSVWPTSLNELDLQLPADMTTETEITHGVCRKNDKQYCCLTFPASGFNYGSVTCGPNDVHIAHIRRFASDNGSPEQNFSCRAKEEKYKEVCKAISGLSTPTGSASIPTPTGWVDGYSYYKIQ